jgi:hypothetical protein
MYDAIQALLISWDKANPSFGKQLNDLKAVFEHPYNFGTTHIDLPSVKPDRFLADEVSALLGHHDSDGYLLIIYYGGHADVKNGLMRLKWYI